MKKFNELNLNSKNVNNNDELSEKSQLFSKSRIITGEGLTGAQDLERIHIENVERLSKMSKDEILNEQKKLLETLDPKIISFIRKRSAKTCSSNTITQNTVESNKVATKSNESVLNVDDLPFKQNNKWLNMNKIEYEKLAWMSTTLKNHTNNESNDINSARARFDFNGKLINPEDNEKISTSLALHHHGYEPDKAGYTIDELYQLIRSQFNQQRFIAIKCLANIVKSCHLGEYTLKLKDAMLFDQLIDSGLIFLLRWSLDNQIESIINITLNAFLNLLSPFKQEHYFDYMFNVSYNSYQCSPLHPYVKINQEEIKQLNDLEYLKIDTIKALFRMNLIERFSYLIEHFKLNSNTSIIYILQILIRIARHSTESCYELYEKHKAFIQLIIKCFIPISWSNSVTIEAFKCDMDVEYVDNEITKCDVNAVYNVPYKDAIKFIRLLCQSSRSISLAIYKTHDFKSIIIRYLTLEHTNEENFAIKIEMINLLKVFTIYELTYDCITDAYELLIKQLSELITNKFNNRFLLYAYLSLFNALLMKMGNQRDFNLIYKNLSKTVLDLVLCYVKNTNSSSLDFDLNSLSLCIQYITGYLQIDNSVLTEHSSFQKHELCSNLLSNTSYLHEMLSNEVKLEQITRYLIDYSFITNEDAKYSINLIKANNLRYLPTYLIPVVYLDNKFNNGQKNHIEIFSFLINILKLLLQAFYYQLDNMSQHLNLCKKVIKNSYVNSYLKKAFYTISENERQMQYKDNDETASDTCYLTKFEIYFAYYCVKLALNIFNYQV